VPQADRRPGRQDAR